MRDFSPSKEFLQQFLHFPNFFSSIILIPSFLIFFWSNLSFVSVESNVFRAKHMETDKLRTKLGIFAIPQLFRFGVLRNRNVSVVSTETKRLLVP